ncbi:MAG: hypothetical protein J5802_10175 [Butyrivibrio sp.]|nr:hypothetical protein [Butyrivibrio sp.]
MRAHNDWKKLHQDYLESGVTKVEFSKMLGVHPTTVYKQFAKFEQKPKEDDDKTVYPEIVPVTILPSEQVQKQEELSNTGNVIISVGKCNITVENKTPVTLLKDVLSVVGELC